MKGGQLVPASWEHGIDSASFLTPFFSFYLNSIDDLWQGLKTKKESDMAHYDERHYARYTSFIQSRQNRTISEGTYTEKHHILPRSLGGSDEPENIIELTAREHFVAHLILWKVYGGPMATAFWMMHHTRFGFACNGRIYENLRIEIQNSRLGVSRTEETRKKITNALIGSHRTHQQTEQWKMYMSKVHLGKNISEDTREKLREHFTGFKHIYRYNNGIIERKSLPEDEANDLVNKGWNFGRGGESHMKNKRSIYRKVGHKIEQKFIEDVRLNDYIQDGWMIGTGRDGQISNTQEGRRWMYVILNDSKKQKLVKRCDIVEYLRDGWLMGRGPKKCS